MTPAIFSLQSYIFDKVFIDLSTLDNNLPFTININPEGQYNQTNGEFILSFTLCLNLSSYVKGKLLNKKLLRHLKKTLFGYIILMGQFLL